MMVDRGMEATRKRLATIKAALAKALTKADEGDHSMIGAMIAECEYTVDQAIERLDTE